MGTTAYGGKGSKGRAANGDRPVGAASCRRDHHTMASHHANPPPPPASLVCRDVDALLWGHCCCIQTKMSCLATLIVAL